MINNPTLQSLNDEVAQSLCEARILVVDDEPMNIQIINRYLSPFYHIYQATSGQQSIDFCLRSPPDLVLMDVRMPDMDGLQTCEKIKAMDGLSALPIIFVTDYDVIEEQACWDAGGVDFLTKPINQVTLCNRVKAQLTLKIQNDWLTDIAYFDGLTGVYNRRYFDDYIQRQVGQSNRLQQPFSIMMIDIDYFKQYNDCYGHLSGDDCLRTIARSLMACLQRPADILARYGGEEFVAVLPNTTLEGTLYLADAMLQEIKQRAIQHKMSPFGHVTISIGIAYTQHQIDDPEKLTQIADQNLYRAKQNGRNQFICQDQ